MAEDPAALEESRQLVEEIALQVHFQALEDVNAALAKRSRCSKRDAQLLYLEQAVSRNCTFPCLQTPSDARA